MIFLSYLFSYCFISSPIFLTILFFIHLFFFIWIRATLPRLRYDHLMKLCWYNLLPIIISYFIFYYSIIIIML